MYEITYFANSVVDISVTTKSHMAWSHRHILLHRIAIPAGHHTHTHSHIELRRLCVDITYTILFGLIDVDSTQFFNIYNGPPLRGHIYRLLCNTQRLNTGLHFFSSRVIAPWNSLFSSCVIAPLNSLPVDVISFKSLNSFKLSLAKVDLSGFVYFS